MSTARALDAGSSGNDLDVAPTVFDPVLYVADMRRNGVKLAPFTGSGRCGFAIVADEGGGINGEFMAVTAQHEDAISRHPDWQQAVYRVLIADDNGTHPNEPKGGDA